MFLVKKSPRTPALRHWLYYKEENLWLKKRLKSKVIFRKKKSGRNNQGCITVRRKSRGHKKLYRVIDNLRENQEGIIVGLEYDPFRTSFISRVYNYLTKKYFYILAPKNIVKGSLVKSGLFSEKRVKVRLGNALSLKEIPKGSLVHNLGSFGSLEKERKVSGGKGQMIRSGGGFGQLLEKKDGLVRVRLSSGEIRVLKDSNVGTLGSLSNEKFRLNCKGKAGRSRWLGKRPKVRGVAMNPVDHPHGGGEGKTSGGRPSVTP